MNKLSPEAASVLEVARSEYAPTQSDRRRLREEIRKRVAASAAVAVVSEPKPSGGPGILKAHGLKLVAVGACVLAAFTATQYALVDAPSKAPAAERGPASIATTERLAIEITEAPSASSALRAGPETSPELLPDAPAAPGEGRAKATAGAPKLAGRAARGAVTVDAPDPIDTLGAEMKILRDAHAAVKSGELARARKALDEHASSYPRGALREERLALTALVLCAEGRHEDARKAAEELARQSPHSSHLERLRGSCAADATSAPARP